MKKIIFVIVVGLMVMMAGGARALPPPGFVNYDVWERLPCLDVVLGGQEFHVHGFDRNGDKNADAAELYKPPYSRGQSPTLYSFDIDGNGEFDDGELFTAEEVMKER